MSNNIQSSIQNIDQLATVSVNFPHHKPGVLTHFPLFVPKEGETKKFATTLIYAPNGSGKSTLARALGDLSKHPDEREHDRITEIKDREGKPIDINDRMLVRVFNESFVDKSVLQQATDKQGLESVILLGAAAEVDTELKEITEAITKRSKEMENRSQKLGDLQKQKHTTEQQVKDRLSRGPVENPSAAWKERYKHLGESRKNITSQVLKRIEQQSLPADFNYDDSSIEFDELAQRLSQHNASPDPVQRLETPKVPDLSEITKLLKEDLSPRSSSESLIGQVLATLNLGEAPLKESRDETFARDASHCTHCFQEIRPDYRQEALRAIETRLSELAGDDRLKRLPRLKLNYDHLSTLPDWLDKTIRSLGLDSRVSVGEFRTNFKKAVKACADSVDGINTLIDKKLSHPNESFSIPSDDDSAATAFKHLAVLVGQINKKIDEYNKSLDEVDSLRKSAEDLNTTLAKVEISGLLKVKEELNQKIQNAESKLTELEDTLTDLREQKKKLEAHRENEDIALEKINSLLRIVFAGPTLQLVPSSTHSHAYAVLNRNDEVRPDWLSTGERNILALCYFIVKTAENKDFDSTLGQNTLLVFDDPVSTFDLDHKYGVYALISYVSDTIHNLTKKKSRKQKPLSSRILILTHDAGVFGEIYDMFKDMSIPLSRFSLSRDGHLVEIKHATPVDIYRDNLRKVYDFVHEPETGVIDDSLPNRFRRVWEGFFTFEFGNVKFGSVLQDGTVRSIIEKRLADNGWELHKHLLTRIILHPDSHAQYALFGEDYYLTSVLAPNQYRRFFSESLAIMHTISPNHIPGRLANKKEDFVTLKKEMDDLTERIFSLQTIGTDSDGHQFNSNER